MKNPKKIVEAREKLVEKNIDWKEVYTKKTKFLKDMYHDIVGPGSYFRFEGTSNEGISYFCILGPARIHDPKAKFFAGARRLPANYAAGGKDFDSLDEAANHARETWGVKTPKSLKPYNARHLYGISAKVDAWKKHHEEEKEDDKVTKEKNDKSK